MKVALMQRFTIRLTSKYRNTIPKAVRNVLHLKAKDQIIYEILEDDTVIIRKASILNRDNLNASKHLFSEWESLNDEQAYKNL